ncbi:MAG TPA: efflux RND transporter periplasmic adaptor subunit [Abditibacteriaceae bacterium]
MNRLRRQISFLVVLLCALTFSTSAFAGGDPSDGHTHGPSEETSVLAVSAGPGATETEIELRLADLNAGATGTEPPLTGATVRGLLKRAATGETLGRVTAHTTETPGAYKLHFGEREAYSFAGPGKYALELNIQPPRGDAIDTTVEFTLAPALQQTSPLWSRALPFAFSALAFIVVLLVVLRRRRPPTSSKSGHDVVQKALVLALCLGLGARHTQMLLPAWAGGDPSDGHTHGPAEEAPAVVTAANPNIQPGEVTTTAKAGPIRITVITRTRPATPQPARPDEVSLPAQTAQLLQIKTQPVTLTRLATGITFTGQIAPDPNGVVRIASVVPGRITRLAVGQGDMVRSGDVVAVVESRAVGEAQSAYAQALARFRNAQSNLSVVQQQARAGAFSRAPLDAAKRAQAEAAGDVRVGEAAVAQARAALENTLRLARIGAYASPALEEARRQEAAVEESLRTAEGKVANAQAEVENAGAELRRRQAQAAAGSYQSRPVEEARRNLVAAQAARGAASSDVATTRAILARARTLAAEGLVSRRDEEAAQQAYDTAAARLETAQADERAAQQQLERQQRLASSNVSGVAEVQQAQSALDIARNNVRQGRAEVEHEHGLMRLARVTLSREQAIFRQNLANRREVTTARTGLLSAQAGLYRARRVLETANTALQREQNIFRQNLNNTSQVQTARAGYLSAQADLRAARSALSLLQSSPGGSVAVPILAPLSGVVQTRDVAVGELIGADAPLMTIVNLNRVALEAALFETDFARVRIGSPVRVTTDAAPGRAFSGRISFLGSSLDPQTRTATARAIVDNPGLLRPGMFARGQIQTGIGKLSVTVPAPALLDDGAAKIVFVAQGGKYLRREVTTGNTAGGRIEITSGLKQGEVVVTSGGAALRAQAAKGS